MNPDRYQKRKKSLRSLRRNVEEENVIGFVHESEEIIKRLIEGDSPLLKVTSIIGMGGLGKTTLARKVYNSDKVKKHFDCRTWVYVSNECRARELLLDLLQNLMENHNYESRSSTKIKKGKEKHNEAANNSQDISSLSEDELKKRVWECLKFKKYLLILDDLWKIQDWDEFKEAFPDGDMGSRILITSRLKEVALHTSRDPVNLKFLSDEQSWELFSKKVFRGEDYPCELESLGKQIAKSCGGLPLSIVVLAGLLANKEKSSREWSKVKDHVNWYLTQDDETTVKDVVLKLSLDDLPSRLKLCFLYLGIFPEDFEICVRTLLHLWVAEGFIQEIGSRGAFDVAEDYLYELIDRSLIQVSRKEDIEGVQTCRIHDLLRDLCILESKDDKIFEVCTDTNILIPTKSRRLAIHSEMSRYVSSCNKDHSCVRSLFFTDPNCSIASAERKWLMKEFKLVRVLDLEGRYGFKIPSNLGNFIHLRYLRIASEDIRSVPNSICSLRNLQTIDIGPPPTLLDLINSTISFPYGILKLKHLTHVYTRQSIMLRGSSSKSDGEVMWHLQTIGCIMLTKKTAYLIEKGCFPKLTTLRLHVSLNFKDDVSKMLPCLQQLNHLNKLEIQIDWSLLSTINRKPEEVLQCLQQLRHLSILKMVNPPNLATDVTMLPPNITKLTLVCIENLNDGEMKAIGRLGKLQILILQGRFPYEDSSFDFNIVEDGFPQLKEFKMAEFRIRNWKLANGSMSRLQILTVKNCPMLESLPSELWSLTSLRKVYVKKPSYPMAAFLQNLEVHNECELIVA